ncbi:histidine kinase N-terminal 7TM domain-containing protein [Pectinatus frisingensis]|uniref:sensor histidine kinase n=1 Tax=Pectinatus frisingensis TaxID=865 RepID=UPI0018C5B4AF|nr:histidine kinase N-terminal 7TM domain-containing protein [Pectinatus frisingensis]
MSIQEYPPIENIWFYLLVVGTLISMSTYIWQFRKTPGAKSQVYAQICKCTWLLASVLMTISPGLPHKLFWNNFLRISCILSPYFWFLFVVEISGQKAKIPITFRYCIRTIIICLILGILTNFSHKLFWRYAWLEGQILSITLGPGVWVARLTSYLLCLLATVFSIRWIFITVGLRRHQALWFTFAAMFSVIGSILNFVPSAQKIAPLPLNFLINGVLLTWGFYHWHIYNILPLSQEIVIHDMIDGLIVIDEYDYIVDLNPSALSIFSKTTSCKIGDSFTRLTTVYPELAAITNDNIITIRGTLNEHRYYRLNMTLMKTHNQCLGKIIVLKDITKQKNQQTKLIEQQKALSILTERQRLGREIHDDRAQTCHFISLELQTIHFLLNTGQIKKAITQLNQLKKIIKNINTDIRESIMGLKKQDIANCSLENNLHEYLTWYEKNRKIKTRLILPKQSIDKLLSNTAKLQLLRIIQEALTNIRKHAHAQQITVQLKHTNRQITTIIEDDGCGFDPSVVSEKDKSFGLGIMAERAKEAGGQLQIDTQPGKGTKVIVHLNTIESEVQDIENTIG